MGVLRSILIPLYACKLAYAASPPVKVSLRSSWAAPHPLVEILETVAQENQDAFFPLLDALTDGDKLVSPQSLTPEAVYQAALEVAASGGLLSKPGSLAAVELNLALHSATPTIEAFHQYYENLNQWVECGSWVDWYGQVVCDIEELARLAGVETLDANITEKKYLLAFDHVYPDPQYELARPPRTAILYASLFSPNFRDLHSYLYEQASRPATHVEYVVRYVPEPDARTPNSLSGYGVSLDLKKTDYLVVDDRTSQMRSPDGIEELTDDDEAHDNILTLIEAYPANDTGSDPSAPLSEDEIRELDMKATQIIVDSPDPLRTLLDLAQNFPRYAAPLARHSIPLNDTVAAELAHNAAKVQQGGSMMWLNGKGVAERDITAFGLLRLLRKEREVVLSLTELGLSAGQAVELITHPAIAAAQKGKDYADGVFDASDREEGGDVIVWWNNMLEDSRYARWQPSINALLRPLYPGQFPSLKLNLFNIVIVADLADPVAFSFVSNSVSNIIDRNFPFRFGVVPIGESLDSQRLAKLFYGMIQEFGRKKTITFMRKVAARHTTEPRIDWGIIEFEYDDMVDQLEAKDPSKQYPELDDLLNRDVLPQSKIRSYTERLDLDTSSNKHGHVFVNGKYFELDDTFLRAMQSEVALQTNFLQEQLYAGQLSEDDSARMETYFYDLPGAQKRRNAYIYQSTDELVIESLPELLAKAKLSLAPSSYVCPPEAGFLPLTTYVVADLDSEEGLRLVKEALLSLDETSRTRLSFIHNPKDVEGSLVDKQPYSAQGSQTPLSREGSLADLVDGISPGADVYESYVKSSVLLARELRLEPGQSAVVANGRVIGPIEKKEFQAVAFKDLEEYEMKKRVGPVTEALSKITPEALERDRASVAELLSTASSVVASLQIPDPSEVGLYQAPANPRLRNYNLLEGRHTSFEFGDNSTALYQLAVIADPLSEAAQKWAPLLAWLANVPDIYIQVYLNPAPLKELPLKRFYRYNVRPALEFDEQGNEVTAETVFRGLPVDPIYTLGMDVPQSWLVRPKKALYDLDNVQLNHLDPQDDALEAVFDLDYIVVEGHAREGSGAPPRGLQLELLAGESPIDDTLVVANLGYLQFKGKPGVYRLAIRPGVGPKVYELESVGSQGWDSPPVNVSGPEIAVTSFEGITLYPRFARRPGMERADVLSLRGLPEEPKGLLESLKSSLTSWFSNPPPMPAEVGKAQADINIFTVASGLLYERFASIMILSVLRNTNSTVKFWFIENFLSPTFLEFIPHFAEEYNFQYELVTYKWPSWLRQQKEKQRIIWAYKILFLDVLFPMDLKKVIFVDADQIVRADLKELVDLDLHGAPYGYTPMGDDNTEMEGFRFWKSGYWHDFLRGRPYHISALYVIDLDRFRRMAAGDILRQHYQALSADPGSLANLDQDLPNNLQREVPIFSLPEDWLWCETWCSKDRLHRAKTIDLCQNPLTKEPKLSRARQIPEWEVHDAEIAGFTRRLAEEGAIQSRLAAADANALANSGGSTEDAKTVASSASEVETQVAEPEEFPIDTHFGHVAEEL
ncbi:glycosyltransferase family 24 protein [Schizophyllum commune Loenen D]|nr:glycosyltransferase family 24 protein [Schizophyllum commune Loenen D]